MSIEIARAHLKQFGKDKEIQIMTQSTATVELAAAAIGVLPGQIAKSLTFTTDDGCILVVVAGDKRVDNKKYKKTFGRKANMCKPDDVEKFTGHAIGGVCPFGIINPATRVYLDGSLKAYDSVYPAAGSDNSMIHMTLDELFVCSGATDWVDVSK